MEAMFPVNKLKQNDSVPKNNKTNTSVEDFETILSSIACLWVLLFTNWDLKWNLPSKRPYEENEYKAYQIYYLYKCSRMSIEILAHNFSSNYFKNL